MRPLSRRNFMQSMGSLLVLPLLRREEPETILYNGNIWTTDEAQPRAQAVAIRGGRLLAVGSNADVLPLATARTRKIDLASKSVLPGFNDAHAHPVDSGVEHLRKAGRQQLGPVRHAIRQMHLAGRDRIAQRKTATVRRRGKIDPVIEPWRCRKERQLLPEAIRLRQQP